MGHVGLDDPLVHELLEAPLIARIATHNSDQSIHLVPVWFSWDGESIHIPTRGDQRKVSNIQADPRVTVLVDDSRQAFDFCGLMVVGYAELITGVEARSRNRRIHLRYVDEVDLALGPVKAALETDDTTIRVTVRKVIGWDYRHIERERLSLRERAP
ncbi:MAG: pyridoxamine 5'-phosphate oxidase family protein [Jiangellaceae bacterium]